MRRIEFYSTNEGFEVLFLDFDSSTVEKIKKYSISLLAGMGYEIGSSSTEKGEGFYFFIVESSNNEEKIKANDLLYSLRKAAENIENS